MTGALGMTTRTGSGISRLHDSIGWRILACLCACLYLTACASPGDTATPGETLAENNAYVLIRVGMDVNTLSPTVIRDIVVFANADTDGTFNVPARTDKIAGQNASLSLVSAPEGNYFFSRYLSSENTGPMKPVSKSAVSSGDIFQLRAGYVNYVGDWTISQNRSQNSFSVDVWYDLTTVDKAFEFFRQELGSREICVSMRGKQAIPLNDFLAIINRELETE